MGAEKSITEFSVSDLKQAEKTIQLISHMEIDGIKPYDLLTAMESLGKQYPMQVQCRHNPGEESALIECGSCGHRTIINYDLYRRHYEKWYCKRCGQRCVLPEIKGQEDGRDK